VIARVVPSRPRAGDFVRVYNAALDGRGGTFNAIDGAACTNAGLSGGRPVGLPADPCSPENPNVVTQNHVVGRANRVIITMGDQQIDADVHAVTPTMLIFRMPVDCFTGASLVVTRGNDSPSPSFTLCDPSTCADRPTGAPCDTDDVCALDQRCDGNGACVAGRTITCTGPCLTGACDPTSGCVVAATDPSCNDGNPCTADSCVAAATCQSIPQDGTACPPADACHTVGTCRAGSCDGGTPLQCNDGDFCTDDVCDPATGCRHPAVTGLRRSSCRVEALRALLASFRGNLGPLSRRLTAQLERADKALARAQAAGRPKKIRSALAKARLELRAFIRAVRDSSRLGGALERQLVDNAKAAMAMARPGA
jgi:hypothetical protein